jgi:hypothetical protein
MRRMIFAIILAGLVFPITGQGTNCLTLPLSPRDWQQGQARFGRLEQTQNGLLLRGDNWTNGGVVNGRNDGNAVVSANQYDLRGGGDVFVVFGVDGGGKYMAIFPRLFTTVSVPHLTTHHSWAGSVVVPEKQWLFAHLQVDAAGRFQLTVSRNNFDTQGGQVLMRHTGTMATTTGRVDISFGDNYAGTGASLVIHKVVVCPSSGGGGGGGGGRQRGPSGPGPVFTAGGGGNQLARTWYVGTRPSKYRVGRVYCAIASDGAVASAMGILIGANFPHIAFGPASFPECVAWVDASENRWWPVSEEWFVGARSEMDGTVRYAVAENSGDGPASYKLVSSGYTSIVFGPATYQDCADWLAARGVTGF